MENLMRKKTKNISLIFLFLIGLSILLYPVISNQWNQYRANKLINKYQDSVKENSNTNYDDLIKAAQNYNETLLTESMPDAFSIRENIQDEKYESLLNINRDGMMGYIEIPSIEIQIPIYHYTTDEVLDKGVGHLFGSSLPVGGQNTHVVLSAHRGLPSQELFTNLNLLESGDQFYLDILNQKMAYEVIDIQTVLPEQTESLGIKQDEDLVTLITCTPYAVNSHRLLVTGKRIDYTEDTKNSKSVIHRAIGSPTLVFQLLSVVIGFVIAFIVVIISKRRTVKR